VTRSSKPIRSGASHRCASCGNVVTGTTPARTVFKMLQHAMRRLPGPFLLQDCIA
jgi:hypothetical protein